MSTTKPTSGPELLDSLALDDPAADSAEPWPTSPAGKGFRVRLPVAAGTIAAVALLGAWAGATLKSDSASTNVTAAGRGAPNGANGANGGFPNPGQAPTGQEGAGGFPGGRGGGGITGEVTEVEGETITLTDAQGNQVTVKVSSDTTYTETVDAALSDIEPGTTIAVRGTTTDGVTDAQSITVNPASGDGFPGGQFPPNGFPGGGQFPGAAGGNSGDTTS